MKKKEEVKAYHQKMADEELQLYLHFRKRGFKIPSKKGKGSYNRKDFKRGMDF